MKFTTLVPTTYNDGTPVKPTELKRLKKILWEPFGGMTDEGIVNGCWIDEEGTLHTDVCIKISIECDRSLLNEAIRRVRRVGRKLGQLAMYFEVFGYDGVQILSIDP